MNSINKIREEVSEELRKSKFLTLNEISEQPAIVEFTDNDPEFRCKLKNSEVQLLILSIRAMTSKLSFMCQYAEYNSLDSIIDTLTYTILKLRKLEDKLSQIALMWGESRWANDHARFTKSQS